MIAIMSEYSKYYTEPANSEKMWQATVNFRKICHEKAEKEIEVLEICFNRPFNS
jgi:hypothetical protein